MVAFFLIQTCQLNLLCVFVPGGRFGASKMHSESPPHPPSPPVAQAAVYSKKVVLLLVIYCLMYFPLLLGALCVFLCFGTHYFCFLSSFAIILKRERGPGLTDVLLL